MAQSDLLVCYDATLEEQLLLGNFFVEAAVHGPPNCSATGSLDNKWHNRGEQEQTESEKKFLPLLFCFKSKRLPHGDGHKRNLIRIANTMVAQLIS